MTGPATPPGKPLNSWVAGLSVGVILLGVLTVAGGLLLIQQPAGGFHGPRPIVTETRLKNPETGLTLTKRVEQLKSTPGLQQITLAIGGPRSVPEPFAFYQHETRSEFHWDHDKLDACIEGEGYADKGAYWSDHIDLPDGGEVVIVKTCSGPRIIPSAPAP